ncbi:MAG: ribosomal protein S18-alanine N-acetyltransferase [Giesbergeria sp.]|jgi:ribosomal-protein-alanine N-acetyltransferase|nr:ribosomal protein S18-alanine N-acetyltransferase [Giesbergeria sp.]MBP6375355.1 ribosomal protein S18-alanine N-acetyltransferase [Giesbergeria sp.]MBP8029154.1 ribosomal protein S18-alanine N-acetyltransferase [Giesbergeria sp.]
MKAANLLSQYASTPQADQARLELLSLQQPGQLDALMAVEQRAYSHPWSRGNFTDSLASGYQIELLLGGEQVIGYFVAMPGVEEAHLLNITVAPEFQQQGWSVVLLDALALWARGRGAQWLWLEVRVSNLRARQVYEKYGFQRVGERKRYYPSASAEREDAIVMSYAL